MKAQSSFRILPVLMIAAALCFGVRFNDVLQRISLDPSSAYAAAGLNGMEPSAGEEPPPASELKGAGEADGPKAAAPEEKKETATAPATTDKPAEGKPKIEAPSLSSGKKEDWKASDDLDDEYSDVKMELFADLAKRRKDMEAKEKELAMREALLKATQAELEQKTQELNTIKTDIETLLKQQTDQENQRIASLVKIYEGMKAKDAARIFDSLEMDVLLQVMTKMSERKSAPILAAMDPEKARNLTIMLAQQSKLPSLPDLPSQ
jgi:flagellar motility protein MotE (MotC chaperone)